MVRSKTGLYGPVQLFLGPDRTAVPECRTVWSSLFIGLHFEARDRTVFSQTGPYFSVWTAVPIDQTVRSGLFNSLQKRPQSGTGPDRGQSTRDRASFIME